MKHWGKNAVFAICLLSAGFFGAYLRYLPYLGSEGTYTDGVRTYEDAVGEKIRYAVWQSPEALTGEVSAEEDERSPAIAPDGRTLVFAVDDRLLGGDLWVATLTEGVVSDPRPLVELNSEADERTPTFSEDYLYFASDRSGGLGGLDLWRARFDGTRFGPPELLPEPINSPADDSDPAPLGRRGALAFASDREGSAGWDLYHAKPTLEEDGFLVEALEALNSPRDERDPAYTAAGKDLFFASNREGSLGGFDLYRSVHDRGLWLPPESLVGVNGEASERGPEPSVDGFSLYFSRETEEPAALFRARSLELFRVPGRPVGWWDLCLLASLLLLALLSVLAKRWKTIDVLYKCFLFSFLGHLLLLLWFQLVGIGGEETELPGRAPMFQVRLASSRATSAASTRAFEGELRTERTESASRPERAASVSTQVERASAPAVEVALAAAAPEPAPGFERSEVERARSESARVAQETPVARATESFELRDQEAPALALEAAREATAARAERASEPSRTSAVEASAVLARTESPPAREPNLELVREPAAAAAAPSRSAPAVERESGRVSVAMAELPREASPRAAESGSPEAVVELSAQRFERPSEAGAAPSRSALPAPPPSAPTREASPERLTLATPSPRPETPTEREARPPERTPSSARALPVELATRAAERPEPVVATPTPREEADFLGLPKGTRLPEERRAPERTLERRTAAAHERAERPDALAPIVARAPAVEPDRAVPRREGQGLDKWEHTPYRSRFGVAKEEALEAYGGSRETEEAVARGLAYLASVQDREGYWGSTSDHERKYGYALVGKTGLALLAFLGAGHTPSSQTAYSDVTERAVTFLLAIQDRRGGHFGNCTSYGHGIATYALAECYALTGEERLREPLERGVAQILRHQKTDGDRRLFGGWSYYYPDPDRTYDRWPRVSITAWQVMALESARLSGLSVPDEAFAGAKAFLIASIDSNLGGFRYSHDPSRLSSTYATLPGSTPAGLFALSILGEDIAHPVFDDAREYVSQRSPRGYRMRNERAFVREASGNLYFWYYGSLALFRHGGDVWRRWNAQLQETLLPAQNGDGSWDPISVYAQRYAGDDGRDSSYSTAMCVLTLEVYYRYFTPLLQVGQETE